MCCFIFFHFFALSLSISLISILNPLPDSLKCTFSSCTIPLNGVHLLCCMCLFVFFLVESVAYRFSNCNSTAIFHSHYHSCFLPLSSFSYTLFHIDFIRLVLSPAIARFPSFAFFQICFLWISFWYRHVSIFFIMQRWSIFFLFQSNISTYSCSKKKITVCAYVPHLIGFFNQNNMEPGKVSKWILFFALLLLIFLTSTQMCALFKCKPQKGKRNKNAKFGRISIRTEDDESSWNAMSTE